MTLEELQAQLLERIASCQKFQAAALATKDEELYLEHAYQQGAYEDIRNLVQSVLDEQVKQIEELQMMIDEIMQDLEKNKDLDLWAKWTARLNLKPEQL